MENNVYIKQIFNEGLGTIFYQKPLNIINKHFKNRIIKKCLLFTIGLIYIIFLIIISIIVFTLNFPF